MVLAALAGVGLVATPGTARADFLIFTVNEAAVPGVPAGTPTYQADKLNGGYVANLALSPAGGGCPVGSISCGSWTESATANFTQYYLGLNPVNGALIGDSSAAGYNIVGSLTSAGTYIQAQCQFSTDICYFFTFTSQSGTLALDTDLNGTGDIDLLTASGVAAGTTGSIRLDSTGTTLLTGSFNSNFLNNALAVNATAPAYWPTLALSQFTTTINGDVDQGTPTGGTLRGDVSVQFTSTVVPEPATLGLLSLGLAAGARRFRRRRAENV